MAQFREAQPETANVKSSCHCLCLVLMLIIQAWKSHLTVCPVFFLLSRPVEKDELAVIPLSDRQCVYVQIYVHACQCIVCAVSYLRATSWAECEESG